MGVGEFAVVAPLESGQDEGKEESNQHVNKMIKKCNVVAIVVDSGRP